MCPGLNADSCIDASGVTYTVSCNRTLTGELVTNTESASLEACMALCDAEVEDLHNSCVGVSYMGINCMVFATISGTSPTNSSVVAAIKAGESYLDLGSFCMRNKATKALEGTFAVGRTF